MGKSREGRRKRREYEKRQEVRAGGKAIDAFMQAIEDAEAQEALCAIDENREPREMFICPSCGNIDFNAIQEKKN